MIYIIESTFFTKKIESISISQLLYVIIKGVTTSFV
jgi:hypothetical protein